MAHYESDEQLAADEDAAEAIDPEGPLQLNVVVDYGPCAPDRLLEWHPSCVGPRSVRLVVRYAVVRVPDEVAGAVRVMMDRLGLAFGAFDFIVRRDGQWVFIELNPNGQWAWIEQEVGLPISAALADVLEKGAIG
ncbi:hypothetical protein OG394_28235 [Kribbella sp. NBC_01245]|uniref:hypothetical protein n=1 Tax=Kribbella sp. NBC_01245 TaxID=2903578 RepID=UPI002E29D6A3|nr:hypothetical protein [Kribbella sp. NBC_01245]